jgi:hypothetical protein
VHCRVHPEIDLALAEIEDSLLSALLVSARRTWAGMCRQAVSLRQALSTG